jgi:hypothetical protein
VCVLCKVEGNALGALDGGGVLASPRRRVALGWQSEVVKRGHCDDGEGERECVRLRTKRNARTARAGSVRTVQEKDVAGEVLGALALDGGVASKDEQLAVKVVAGVPP